MPTLGSLFAGIGGIDLGFERAGFTTSWQVEIDPFCRKVLAKNFPKADRSVIDVKCGNAGTLSRVDVLAGGFPCQDISIAGRGEGIGGARSGLWKEQHRIIGDLRPKYVLVENVGALLGRGMGVVLGDLSEIGYDAEWEIISGRDVGTLHLRNRVWIVAYPNAGEERTQRIFKEKIPRFPAFSWCQNVRRVEDLRDRPNIPTPLFRGTRDGVPNWSYRVGALGNSVIPQIPEYIAGLILKDMIRSENGAL